MEMNDESIAAQNICIMLHFHISYSFLIYGLDDYLDEFLFETVFLVQ